MSVELADKLKVKGGTVLGYEGHVGDVAPDLVRMGWLERKSLGSFVHKQFYYLYLHRTSVLSTESVFSFHSH